MQATKTEDRFFGAYGAMPVHMPIGQVYTSLETGLVDIAENGADIYRAQKHYEVAPVLSSSNHEANNNHLWVSDKAWNKLHAGAAGLGEGDVRLRAEQDGADARSNTTTRRPNSLKKMGVEIFTDVDRQSFIEDRDADPGRAGAGAWAHTR